MKLKWPNVAVILFLFLPTAGAQLRPGLNQMIIRGQRQNVYFLPAAQGASRSKGTVLFSPGDGGWRGFAITIAQQIAAAGYDTYGFDTHLYLSSFTTKQGTLSPPDVMRDYGELIRNVQPANHSSVLLVGWSEGAGLDLLAASAAENSGLIAGVVAIGLPTRSILGWRTADNITWITKKLPNEPTFASSDYLDKVKVPFFMMHSRVDEFTPISDAEQMFNLLKFPKQFVVINARNHRFDGAQDEFFSHLSDGLHWIQANR
jgi:pimeloyl-ACP methyl ester carboxylesterase